MVGHPEVTLRTNSLLAVPPPQLRWNSSQAERPSLNPATQQCGFFLRVWKSDEKVHHAADACSILLKDPALSKKCSTPELGQGYAFAAATAASKVDASYGQQEFEVCRSSLPIDRHRYQTHQK
eukprot:1488969-Amphidinium_carterae.1